MNIEHPLSYLFSFLVLLLPGIWISAKLFCQRLCHVDRTAEIFLVPGFFIIFWLLSVHLLGLISHGFYIALIVGTLIPSIPGAYVYFRKPELINGFYWNKLTFKIILSALLAAVVLIPVIVFWEFHDKAATYYGHLSFSAQMINDIYPPRDMMFPFNTLRYHYGVDTLYAMIIALTRLPGDIAIDLVTLVFWFYTLCLFGLLCSKLYGQKAAIWGVLIGAFGGGFLWFLPEIQNNTYAMLGIHFLSNEGARASSSKGLINAPFISHFFQSPWLIGTPLMLMLLLLWDDYEKKLTTYFSFFGFSLCFLVLSFSNIIIFLTLGASFLALSVFYFLRAKRLGETNKIMLLPTLAVLSALVALPMISGMFSLLQNMSDVSGAGIVFAEQGIAGNWQSNILWNIATFGFLLPLGVISCVKYSRLRWLFCLLIIGSLLSVNFFRYERTHDIVKFATLAQIILAVASTGFIVYLFASKNWLRGIIAVVSSSLVMASGVIFLLPFWLNLPGIPFNIALWKTESPFQASDEQAKAISWLRKHISAGEVVFCPIEKNQAHICASLGGFPQFLPDKYMSAALYGHSNESILKRVILYKEAPEDINLYLYEDLRWLILPDGMEPWNSLINTWIAKENVSLVKKFGHFNIYKLDYPIFLR